MPAAVPPGNATVTVTSAGVTSPPAFVTVAQTAPHIFIFGNNRAGVRNQDNSINTATNPAPAQSAITVYFTGIGPVDNPVADGQPAPDSPFSRSTLPVTAKVGSQDAVVQFTGLTPQAIGLAQLNLIVPSLPPGDYPVTITVGTAQSNSPLITIAPATP